MIVDFLKGTIFCITTLFLGFQILKHFEFTDNQTFDEDNIKVIALSALTLISLVAGSLYAYIKSRKRTKVVFCLFDKLLIYLPFFVALREGYFDKRGINVSVRYGYGDLETWKKVDNSEAQFGLSDPVVMLHNNVESGRLLSVLVNKIAIWGVSKGHHPILKSEADFKNIKTVCGYPENTTTRKIIDYLNKFEKFDRIGEIKPGEEHLALKENENDLFLFPEPHATEAERNGYSTIYNGPLIHEKITFSGIYAKKDYIDSHPKIVENVIEGIQEALNLIHSCPLIILEIADKEFEGYDRITLYKAVIRMLDQDIFPLNSAPNKSEWQAAKILWDIECDKYKYDDLVIARFAEDAFQKLANNKLTNASS